MIDPKTFAGSALVLTGLIGVALLFHVPALGIALIALAALAASRCQD